MDQNVLYRGQRLTLTRFWATGEPCLWITDPEQIGMPKMEFVGGHPDEYCIFLKNLTETELAQITSLDGAPLDVKKELRQFLTGKDNPMALQDTAICLSSIAGAGYSSPFPSHQRVHTRWFGRALEWHSRGQRFDPAYLHQRKP